MTSSTSSKRVPPSLVHDLQAVVPPFRRFLGSSLSANVVLTGLHLEGNLGYVGPRGFLRTIPGRFEDDGATEANESRFRAQILHHPSGKYWGSDRPGGCLFSFLNHESYSDCASSNMLNAALMAMRARS